MVVLAALGVDAALGARHDWPWALGFASPRLAVVK